MEYKHGVRYHNWHLRVAAIVQRGSAWILHGRWQHCIGIYCIYGCRCVNSSSRCYNLAGAAKMPLYLADSDAARQLKTSPGNVHAGLGVSEMLFLSAHISLRFGALPLFLLITPFSSPLVLSLPIVSLSTYSRMVKLQEKEDGGQR